MNNIDNKAAIDYINYIDQHVPHIAKLIDSKTRDSIMIGL